MTTSSSLFSFRLDPSLVKILHAVAQHHCLSPAMMIERLVLEEAKRLGLVQPNNPTASLHDLLNWVNGLYMAGTVVANPHFTRIVFEHLQADPVGLQFWMHATTPLPGEKAAKRRQYVNARVGKYCKALIGWKSDKEVVLPKNAGLLIKGYTQLRP